MSGLQSIKPCGQKAFTKGTRIAAAACVIGEPISDSPTVFITEGFRAGCAIYTALAGAAPVYAAMALSNIKSVTVAARARHQSAHIFICADRDTAGSRYGTEALGTDSSASVLLPTFSSADESLRNFADLHTQESAAVVKAQLSIAIKNALARVLIRRPLQVHDQSSQTTRTD